MRHPKSENPKEEMARLIRVIAGTRAPGETDEHLRRRAARRLGISPGRAKSFWYGETENIRADEMDLARDLAAVQPLENLANAIEATERYLEDLALNGCLTLAERVLAGLQERFVARLGDRGAAGVGHRSADPIPFGRRASDRLEDHRSVPAHRQAHLNTDPGVHSSLAG